jgi:hypothetical protein
MDRRGGIVVGAAAGFMECRRRALIIFGKTS